MPNWCYTKVCFKGKTENICKLKQDVESAFQFTRDTNYRLCNIEFLLAQQGFYTQAYNLSTNIKYSINFRGSVIEEYPIIIKDFGSYSTIYLSFETAWDMDYNLFHLMSMIYQLEFSAYSEELNMGIFYKCRNGYENTYDYDYLIRLNHDQFDDYVYDNPNGSKIEDLGLDIPCKNSEVDDVIKTINDSGMEYIKEVIPEDTSDPKIFGVYYDIE